MPTEGSSSNDTQIEILYAALVNDYTGRSAVTLYELSWDQGGILTTGNYEAINSGNVLNYIKTSLTPGTDYKFTYKAFNKYGWGPESDPATILAAAPPSQVTPAVVTTLNANNVKFSWVGSTYQDNGAAVTAYSIKLKNSSGTLIENSTCDGTNSSIKG
jgi:hypothetical protein